MITISKMQRVEKITISVSKMRTSAIMVTNYQMDC